MLGLHETIVISPEEEEKLQKTMKEKKELSLRKVKEAKEAFDKAAQDLDYQDRTFRLFQGDHGQVIGAVEKHKVHRIKDQRAGMRNGAHDAILTALRSSPALQRLSDVEKEREVKETQELLMELEGVEGETDELVERLELKVSAIQITEMQQSSEIEESLERQVQINAKLDSLNAAIMENNEALNASRTRFRSEIADNIDAVIGSNLVNTFIGGMCCLFIIIAIMAAVIFMVNHQS